MDWADKAAEKMTSLLGKSFNIDESERGYREFSDLMSSYTAKIIRECYAESVVSSDIIDRHAVQPIEQRMFTYRDMVKDLRQRAERAEAVLEWMSTNLTLEDCSDWIVGEAIFRARRVLDAVNKGE